MHHRRSSDDSSVAISTGLRAGQEGREQEFGEVEVAQHIRAKLQVISISRHLAHGRVHNSTIVKEDMQLALLANQADVLKSDL